MATTSLYGGGYRAEEYLFYFEPFDKVKTKKKHEKIKRKKKEKKCDDAGVEPTTSDSQGIT